MRRLPIPALLSIILALCAQGSASQRDGPPLAPSGTLWSQIAELLASNTQPYSFVGASVALEGDTAVVGAPGYINDGNSVPGAAYVFVKPTTGWENMVQTAELTPSDGGNAPGDQFGVAVVISDDVIFVGTSFKGEVYIYVKPAGGWTNMTETAILSNGQNGADGFGKALAISGRTLVVGADEAKVAQGAAYVFLQPAGGWQTSSKPVARLTASDGVTDDNFGLSVSISGNTIAVGAPVQLFNYEYGEAYVFVEPKGGWKNMTETAKLTAANQIEGALLGWSILLNGNTVLAGAPTSSDVPGAGSVHVFVEPVDGWTSEHESAILSDGTNSVDSLGSALAMTGNVLFAGAPSASVGNVQYEGAVYLFAKPATGWKTTSVASGTITELYGESYDEFGECVAVQGTTAVSGAPDAEKALVFSPQ